MSESAGQSDAIGYSPFRIFGRVFRNRKEELLITIAIMLLLMFFSSIAIYLLEHEAQPKAFSNLGSAMWWAVAALTTVGYGDVYPITVAGKVFAAVIAMCGIGMFALPAGILGGGFVDEIEEEKKKRQNLANAKLIKEAFEVEPLIGVRKFKKAHGIDSPRKSIELMTLQNELRLTADDVLHAVKSVDGFRIRNIHSREDSQFEDMVVVERFPCNTPYGSCTQDGPTDVTIINSAAESEAAVGHFSETLAARLNAGYISNEYFNAGALRREFRTHFGINDGFLKGATSECPKFEEFKTDCRESIEPGSVVIILFSAARHRAGISLATGGKKGELSYRHDNSTFEDQGKVEAFHGALAKTTAEQLDDTVADETALNDFAPNRLCQFIRRETGANVLTMRINIRLLRWANMEDYYTLCDHIATHAREHLV